MCECVTLQETRVSLAPRVSVVTGQDAHRLFIGFPGLSSDPAELRVNLTLSEGGAITIVHVQLEKLHAHACTRAHTFSHTFFSERLHAVNNANFRG